jgi:inner membrane protein COX18
VGIHNVTGLSWSLTLPLTALGFRLVISLPFAIYQRRAHQRRAALLPLRKAWEAVFKKATMEKSKHLGPVFVVRDVQRKMSRMKIGLHMRWKCGIWREFLPFLYLPIWLAVVEAVRGMCNARKGLLGLVADGARDVVPAIKTSAGTQETVVQSAPEIFLEAGQAATPMANIQSESVSSTAFEPSMVTEGMLWFPDLTVVDPMHILPFMLSATLLLNVYAAGHGGLPSGEEPLWRKRVRRIMLTLAFAAGPLTLEMPSAILLYWISSGIVGYGHNILLDLWMPLRGSTMSYGPKVGSPKRTK